MEKTVQILSAMKERFSAIDLILMLPSVLVILHGFIR
jgi:hypothetical protein